MSPSRVFSFFLLPLVSLPNILASSMHLPHIEDPARKMKIRQPHLVRGGAAEKTLKRFTESDVMPSLFEKDEIEYDKYAACLAATEGLRRIRDKELAKARARGKNHIDAEKHISAQYVQNSSKVLRALGMSVSQFNELGREIARDDKLKDKVMEQAYLYRMAAAVNMDRTAMIEDTSSQVLLRAFQKDKVKVFCQSVSEIEQLRSNQLQRLQRALQIDKLPAHVSISDPALLPFLSPKVRAVVEAFPLQAEAIVKRHGLQSNEFNQMLAATKNNPMFRWKISKEISRGGASSFYDDDMPDKLPRK